MQNKCISNIFVGFIDINLSCDKKQTWINTKRENKEYQILMSLKQK